MSEQINPIVSEKDMGADGKLRKWSTGRKAKWIIWIVIILAVALGFWHQHYMRSDSQIKAVFNDNKANFQTTAEFMIESISCEKPTLPKGKCSIKSLTENNACKSVKKVLSDIQDGTFAKDFLLDMSDAGSQVHFKAMRKLHAEHPSEKVGKEIRKLYSWNNDDEKLINN